jgi:amino acid adenylation domain-containing protein
MVAGQAREVPAAIAVVAGDRSLSYAELDARSSRVSAYLRGAGVGAGTLVGVCLQRTPDLVVALLGVLRAGATYVPLDPAFPAQRLASMVEDSGLRLVITDAESEAAVPKSDLTLLRIDRDWPAITAALPAEDVDVSADSAAYVLYTSGSTGHPKGVAVPRSALTNFLRSMRAEPGIAASDVLLAVTTLSFDIAALEIFLPLTVGAKVVLASRAEAADGVALRSLLASSGATIMQATPATWRLLVDGGWQGTAGLKVLCGGEALSSDVARQLLPRCGSLWNLYGPTETTIWSTLDRIESDQDISIGHPIANTQVHVVDAAGRPVPIGVPGELCIGGAGVALGYLRRPELTAERFIPDLFSPTPGARMYRTGDLGRWLPDGRLQCLGRLDSQVKVRGFRVELGEIESVLARHPAVSQAVAAVHEDGGSLRRLVAYVVHHTPEAPTASEYRKFLRQELPDYMIPSLFVTLERMPLTPNGKVDRRALPVPYLDGHRVERVAPRTETERVIAGIWQELLKSEVSVHDNFFDVGGYSLLSMQAIARIEAQLGVRPAPTNFIMGTLEQMAAECDRLRSTAPAAVAALEPPAGALQNLKRAFFGRRRTSKVEVSNP